MKYKIVTAKSAEGLEKLVQELMDNHGWEPLGGVSAVSWRTEFFKDLYFEYYQVLINQSEL